MEIKSSLAIKIKKDLEIEILFLLLVSVCMVKIIFMNQCMFQLQLFILLSGHHVTDLTAQLGIGTITQPTIMLGILTQFLDIVIMLVFISTLIIITVMSILENVPEPL